MSNTPSGSPVSDGGRGLKQLDHPILGHTVLGSPVSDGGRGLKLRLLHHVEELALVRPSAMAGVD